MDSTASPRIQLDKHKNEIMRLCTYMQDEEDVKILHSYVLQIEGLLNDKSAPYDKLSLYCIFFSKTITLYLSNIKDVS